MSRRDEVMAHPYAARYAQLVNRDGPALSRLPVEVKEALRSGCISSLPVEDHSLAYEMFDALYYPDGRGSSL